jgi:benzoyl-CoA reductase/2-hydroxyglutaryl-CoA dehydratase subunit BcrC/BadD/HgdB
MISLINRFYAQALANLKKNKVVGYFCCYVPAEIIEACGFSPVRLAGLGDGTAENEGERFIHNEACSFCKECLGLRSLKRPPYDKIDYLIIPSGCDQMKRHGEKWNLEFGVQTYHLFVPATWEDSSSQNIYWQEIKWLYDELAAIAPKKHDPLERTANRDKDISNTLGRKEELSNGLRSPARLHHHDLKTIVRQYNEARKRFMRLSHTLSYNDSFNLAHLFFISPVSDFIHYLDEIENNLKPKPAAEPDKIRLLLVGSPIGHGDNFIQKALEKYPEVDIVYDATCAGHRFFEIDIALSGDIVANIAAGYFSRPPCIWQRPNSQFYQYIQTIIDKYRVDGIIYKTLKFCDLWKYEAKRFADWAKKPVIQIENTYSPAQSAQINKRIGAFIETIKH